MTTEIEPGAPAPEIPEEMILKAADAALDDLLDRDRFGEEIGYDKSFFPETWQEIRQAVGKAALTAAGVPALLARVKELEDALAPFGRPHPLQFVMPEDFEKARAALGKKDAP